MPAAECQKGVKWLKEMSNSQESVDGSEWRQTGMKPLMNQDNKEGRQESARGHQVISRKSSDQWCQDSV